MGKVRLTEVQKRWLADPRPYFNQYMDRTGRALINKGVIKITEEDFSGSGKCGYEITELGRTIIKAPSHGG